MMYGKHHLKCFTNLFNMIERICTICKKRFPATLEYFYKSSNKIGLTADCKCCRNKKNYERYWFHGGRKKNIERKKEYYSLNKDRIYKKTREYAKTHPEKIKQYNQKYWQSEKGKVIRRKWDKKVYAEDREHQLERNKIWSKTPSGKKSHSRRCAKRKGKQFICLIDNPFPEEIKIHWHHVNDMLVIPLPEVTHKYCYYGSNPKNHRILCNKLIRIIYCMDIDNLLKG